MDITNKKGIVLSPYIINELGYKIFYSYDFECGYKNIRDINIVIGYTMEFAVKTSKYKNYDILFHPLN